MACDPNQPHWLYYTFTFSQKYGEKNKIVIFIPMVQRDSYSLDSVNMRCQVLILHFDLIIQED